MSEILNKNQYNENRKRQGYCEYHWLNGNLRYRGNYDNNNRYGYWEYYSKDGDLMIKQFYL